jgi:3-oxocholest-4-en-26-oate---CoA ligase
MSSGWNYADVWEAVAASRPESPALMHGDLVVSWRSFDERANSVARRLLDAGLPRDAKVAQFLRNQPEFLESLFAIFKAALVPVNTNFRYKDEELVRLWEDSQTSAVVFGEEFVDTVERVRGRLPKVRAWICAGAAQSCPDWAVSYEEAASTGDTSPLVTSWDRSGDDLFLLYTGGTTGDPKGVMWRQDDLFRMLETAKGTRLPEPPDPEEFIAQLARDSMTCLPAAPLIHGTACFFVMPILARGGAVVTLTDASLNPVEVLDTVEQREVKGLCIVGEAFARPILRELEAAPDRWDLSSLRVIFSSGAMLSTQSKERFLAFATRAMVVDGLGSSESGSIAHSVATKTGGTETAKFRLSGAARVVDEDGIDVPPGGSGRLAVTGFLPLGYFGDPKKTAETFLEIEGRRYVVAGDWAEVDADGSITLLGRGSSCINTGGEKVYPEEVEEVLKSVEGVLDVGVVGVPDERLGEVVTALVQLEPGSRDTSSQLGDYVRTRLAGYKVPRHYVVVEAIPRGPNGKIDHVRLKEQARSALHSEERSSDAR